MNFVALMLAVDVHRLGILEISYDYWPLAIYLPCTIVFLLIVIGLEIHRVMTYSKDLERV